MIQLKTAGVKAEARSVTSEEIRVLTLNIHKGFSLGRRFTLENIRRCLRDSGATIVFLQEVVGDHSRLRQSVPGWPQANQLEFLADSVWSHYAYGKNAIYQHGHHGNAILSEVPFRSWNNVNISHLRFSQRGILHGTTENGCHLLCIHFGLFEGERRRQTRQLVEYVHESIPAQEPLILAGDFNDWRGSCHRALLRDLNLTEAHCAYHRRMASTFPSFRPLLPMDRIYLRGFRVNSCEIMSGAEWRSISDHCALVAGVVLQAA